MNKYWIILLLSSSAFASSILVRWTPSTTSTVDHYRVMRSLAPGGPYILLGNVAATSSPQFTNGSNPDGTALVVGQQYCYIVVAVAGSSLSSNSNESCAQIQLINPATNVQAFPQP